MNPSSANDILFTLISNWYGTHQTRFTQLVMFAVPLDIIWGLRSLLVYVLQRDEIFANKEGKEEDPLHCPCASRLS